MSPLRQKSRPALGAGVAGASGGTGILALVGSLPDTSIWKPVLTYAAPTIAVLVSAIWLFAKSRFDAWLADRSLAAEIEKAVGGLRDLEGDPNCSEKVKRNARTHVDGLKLLRIQLHSKRVRAIIDA
jgi:hypothetical protein